MNSQPHCFKWNCRKNETLPSYDILDNPFNIIILYRGYKICPRSWHTYGTKKHLNWHVPALIVTTYTSSYCIQKHLCRAYAIYIYCCTLVYLCHQAVLHSHTYIGTKYNDIISSPLIRINKKKIKIKNIFTHLNVNYNLRFEEPDFSFTDE